MAESFGMDILQLKELEEKIGGFEYIYNTIPALVLDEGILKKVGKDTPFTDS